MAMPLREAGLLSGMVWGEKNGISVDLYRLLKNTGLVHMVVVSGANLMIVGKGLIELLAKYLGRRGAIVGGGGIILLYVNLVGWQIPVVRALLFLGIYYLAQILGRKFSSSRAILTVGIIMFLANWRVVEEISFWLSMAAFMAVLLNKNKGIFWSTFWVNIFVLPILSICFGKVSLVSPVMNLGVLFLVEILTILGLVGSLVGLICFEIGKGILIATYPLLRYLIEIVEYGGNWKSGLVSFQFNWLMFFGWYLIVGGYWYEKNKG